MLRSGWGKILLSLLLLGLVVALGLKFSFWRGDFWAEKKLLVGSVAEAESFMPEDCDPEGLPRELRENQDWDRLKLLTDYCLAMTYWQSRIAANQESWCTPDYIARLVVDEHPAVDFFYSFCPNVSLSDVLAAVHRIENGGELAGQDPQEEEGREQRCTEEYIIRLIEEGRENEGSELLYYCRERGLLTTEEYAHAVQEAYRRLNEARRVASEARQEQIDYEENREEVFSLPDNQFGVGVLCQLDFENEWATEIEYSKDLCRGFKNTIDDGGNFIARFARDSFDGGVFAENQNILEAGGADSVDITYIHTHGAYECMPDLQDCSHHDYRDGYYFLLAGFNEDEFFESSGMRFGDHRFDDWDLSGKTSILSLHACATMKLDGHTFERWISPFRGGLLLATGAHEVTYLGYTTAETGQDYAMNLRRGMTVWKAWKDAMIDWYSDTYMAAMSSGTEPDDLSNCFEMLDITTAYNARDYGRFRDDEVQSLCWYYYAND